MKPGNLLEGVWELATKSRGGRITLISFMSAVLAAALYAGIKETAKNFKKEV